MNKLFTISLVLACFFVEAQDNWGIKLKQEFQLADFAFYQEDYVYAHNLLRNVYAADSTYGPVLYEYGTSLLMLGKRPYLAESLLYKAVQKGEVEAIYWYGRALHNNGKHQEAIEQYEKYLKLPHTEMMRDEVRRQKKISTTAAYLKMDPVDVSVKNLGLQINSEAKEYVPVINSDGTEIYFTSRRKNELYSKLDSNKEYFEDIYRSEWIDGEWTEAKMENERINTKTHDATVALSGDGNTMIIYRTNKRLTGGDLYITEKTYGEWKKPKKLNSNINSQHQEASACLSHDGKTMYFSSNRDGGFGGKDLYIVRKLPDGEWSKALNLGPEINTPYDEDAPFINRDGTVLYFSSNGHDTMGGFDVFKSEMGENYWSEPENLGYPINTEGDEIYLTLDETELRGFYSSDKGAGHGQLDIYQIEFIYRKAKDVVVLTDVKNEYEMPVDATITVYNTDSQQLQGIYNTHPETGKFCLAINPRTNYSLLMEAEGHEMKITDLYIEELDDELLQVELETYYLRTK